MLTVVAILDGEARARYEAWQEMLTGVAGQPNRYAFPPHVTLFMAEGVDKCGVTTVLRRIAQAVEPFWVETAGVGLFGGTQPVLFANVVRSPVLARLHTAVWDAFYPCTTAQNFYYHPEQWLPHVTLYGAEKRASLQVGALLAALGDIAEEEQNQPLFIGNVAYLPHDTFDEYELFELGGR